MPSRSEQWRTLDTSTEYVRGEEALNGWSPRGRELVAHYIKNKERTLLLQEVEAWRGRWEQVEDWIATRRFSTSPQWSHDEAIEVEKRVIDLWKGLARSPREKYYNALLGIYNKVSLDDHDDAVNSGDASWVLEVKAIPQRKYVPASKKCHFGR